MSKKNAKNDLIEAIQEQIDLYEQFMELATKAQEANIPLPVSHHKFLWDLVNKHHSLHQDLKRAKLESSRHNPGKKPKSPSRPKK